ncbi:FAD-binding protein [Streptomyces sp. NPDC054933]
MSDRLEGQVLWRGDDGYEAARRAASRHAGTLDRFPAVIAWANSTDDVIAAVRLARDEGPEMAVRSGGRTWAGSHLRDGILLLHVSRQREVSADAEETADAELVHADEKCHPELLWAARGAGLGFFRGCDRLPPQAVSSTAGDPQQLLPLPAARMGGVLASAAVDRAGLTRPSSP